MSSPGQKRGSCGHAMASFGHAFCTRCRDKGKGMDQCVETPQSECKFWIILTPEQLAQLATLSYKLKKEKREAKKLEITPSKDSTLVEPSTVAVIGLSAIQELLLPLHLSCLKRSVRRTSHLLLKPSNLQKSRPQTPEMMNSTRNGLTASTG